MKINICYNCGVDLTNKKVTAEHVPAKNLFEGFGENFKKNRITVPACENCNNLYSKIDQEIRDAIAITSSVVDKNTLFQGKWLRSITRRNNWRDRVHYDDNQIPIALDFSYNDLKKLHIKNFKALFFKKYGFPVPNNFEIEIFADGDLDLIASAQVIYDYIIRNKEWEISGHFKRG